MKLLPPNLCILLHIFCIISMPFFSNSQQVFNNPFSEFISNKENILDSIERIISQNDTSNAAGRTEVTKPTKSSYLEQSFMSTDNKVVLKSKQPENINSIDLKEYKKKTKAQKEKEAKMRAAVKKRKAQMRKTLKKEKREGRLIEKLMVLKEESQSKRREALMKRLKMSVTSNNDNSEELPEYYNDDENVLRRQVVMQINNENEKNEKKKKRKGKKRNKNKKTKKAKNVSKEEATKTKSLNNQSKQKVTENDNDSDVILFSFESKNLELAEKDKAIGIKKNINDSTTEKATSNFVITLNKAKSKHVDISTRNLDYSLVTHPTNFLEYTSNKNINNFTTSPYTNLIKTNNVLVEKNKKNQSSIVNNQVKATQVKKNDTTENNGITFTKRYSLNEETANAETVSKGNPYFPPEGFKDKNSETTTIENDFEDFQYSIVSVNKSLSKMSENEKSDKSSKSLVMDEKLQKLLKKETISETHDDLKHINEQTLLIQSTKAIKVLKPLNSDDSNKIINTKFYDMTVVTTPLTPIETVNTLNKVDNLTENSLLETGDFIATTTDTLLNKETPNTVFINVDNVYNSSNIIETKNIYNTSMENKNEDLMYNGNKTSEKTFQNEVNNKAYEYIAVTSESFQTMSETKPSSEVTEYKKLVTEQLFFNDSTKLFKVFNTSNDDSKNLKRTLKANDLTSVSTPLLNFTSTSNKVNSLNKSVIVITEETTPSTTEISLKKINNNLLISNHTNTKSPQLFNVTTSYDIDTTFKLEEKQAKINALNATTEKISKNKMINSTLNEVNEGVKNRSKIEIKVEETTIKAKLNHSKTSATTLKSEIKVTSTPSNVASSLTPNDVTTNTYEENEDEYSYVDESTEETEIGEYYEGEEYEYETDIWTGMDYDPELFAKLLGEYDTGDNNVDKTLLPSSTFETPSLEETTSFTSINFNTTDSTFYDYDSSTSNFTSNYKTNMTTNIDGDRTLNLSNTFETTFLEENTSFTSLDLNTTDSTFYDYSSSKNNSTSNYKTKMTTNIDVDRTLNSSSTFETPSLEETTSFTSLDFNTTGRTFYISGNSTNGFTSNYKTNMTINENKHELNTVSTEPFTFDLKTTNVISTTTRLVTLEKQKTTEKISTEKTKENELQLADEEKDKSEIKSPKEKKTTTTRKPRRRKTSTTKKRIQKSTTINPKVQGNPPSFVTPSTTTKRKTTTASTTTTTTTTKPTTTTVPTTTTTTTTKEPDPGSFVESGYAICTKFNHDGTTDRLLYDTCTSFCCGGTVYTNKTGLDCCGSPEYGSPIWPRFQKCCEWWTGHGRAHSKRKYTHSASCCGADLVFWGVQQCCFGGREPPQVYDRRRHICCGAKRVSSATLFPWQSKCCGQSASFDGRLQSCPCNDGQVLDIPDLYADCCLSPDGDGTPYNTRHSFCCNGKVGKLETNFCCANYTLGIKGKQVCCNGILKDLAVPDSKITECCNGIPYDPISQICCEGVLLDQDGSSGKMQCCGSVAYDENFYVCCEEKSLWEKEVEGSECCGQFPFFPDNGLFCCNGETQSKDLVQGDACCGQGIDLQYYYKDKGEFICCENVLGLRSGGDSCCGETPYFSGTGICCNGEVFDSSLGDTCCAGSPYFETNSNDRLRTICCDLGPGGPYISPDCCNGIAFDQNGGQVCCQGQIFGIYRQPACCVNEGYDVATHQCCHGEIRPNPPLSKGQAACCGTEVYDTSQQLCCNDVIVDVPESIPFVRAQCCEQYEAYDPLMQLCCEGFVYDKLHRYASQCCGENMYDVRKQICCSSNIKSDIHPELHAFEYGRSTTKCCGLQIYNTNNDYCCGEVISAKIHKRTECCLGIPYDRTKKICCEGNLLEIGDRVPWIRAECCGSRCYYRGPQRCCMNRIYEGNVRSMKTCDLF